MSTKKIGVMVGREETWPPAFIHDIVPKYPALQQRVQSPSYFSRSNPFSPQINLEHLDIPEAELLTQIGARLLPIFEAAYDVGLDPDAQASNIAVLAEAALDSFLAINHRRLSACAGVLLRPLPRQLPDVGGQRQRPHEALGRRERSGDG